MARVGPQSHRKKNLNIRLYTIANITFSSYISIRMLPMQIHPEINCIVSYIMYDICNLISVLTSSISDESQPLRIKSMQNKLN